LPGRIPGDARCYRLCMCGWKLGWGKKWLGKRNSRWILLVDVRCLTVVVGRKKHVTLKGGDRRPRRNVLPWCNLREAEYDTSETAVAWNSETVSRRAQDSGGHQSATKNTLVRLDTATSLHFATAAKPWAKLTLAHQSRLNTNQHWSEISTF
jgi:hypothetical protein